MRNEMFYLQYIYRPELEHPDNVTILAYVACLMFVIIFFFFQRQLKYKVATSFDSKFYFTYCQLPPRVLCDYDVVFESTKSTEKGNIGSPIQSPTEQPPTLARLFRYFHSQFLFFLLYSVQILL